MTKVFDPNITLSDTKIVRNFDDTTSLHGIPVAFFTKDGGLEQRDEIVFWERADAEFLNARVNILEILKEARELITYVFNNPEFCTKKLNMYAGLVDSICNLDEKFGTEKAG